MENALRGPESERTEERAHGLVRAERISIPGLPVPRRLRRRGLYVLQRLPLVLLAGVVGLGSYWSVCGWLDTPARASLPPHAARPSLQRMAAEVAPNQPAPALENSEAQPPAQPLVSATTPPSAAVVRPPTARLAHASSELAARTGRAPAAARVALQSPDLVSPAHGARARSAAPLDGISLPLPPSAAADATLWPTPAQAARVTTGEARPLLAALTLPMPSVAPWRRAQSQVARPIAIRSSEPKPAIVATTPAIPSIRVAPQLQVDRLEVRGPLSTGSVRRALARLRPHFDDCYADAPTAERGAVLALFATIDEVGRVRETRARAANAPALASCVQGALRRLVADAPDTGTVSVTWQQRWQ
jgi:hypothetical protein